MKFCTVLMNWLIWEKVFTNFYNKFRPVSRMHYIKCGVNSSILTILVAAEGLWHLGSLFYHDTQYSKRGWITHFLWCDIPRNRAHLNRPTSYLVHLYTVPLLWQQEAHRWQCIWVDDSRVAKHFLRPHLVLQPVWGWGDLGSFQLPQSTFSPEGAWNLCGYI